MCIRDSTYTEAINVASLVGSSGTITTIKGHTDGTVIVVPASGDAITGLFDAPTVGYITFQGITFQKQFTAYRAHHLTFDNIEVTAVNSTAIQLNNTQDVTIKNSRIHDLPSDCVPGNRWYAIYMASNPAAETPTRTIIENNQFYNLPGGGVHILS